VNDALARIGAGFDTEVGPDATFITLTTLARFRDRGLGLLSDLVIRPRFEAHEFERVRQLRANRLRQLRDLPPAVADRAFASLLYGDHPYGHLAIGTEEALASIALEEVRRFHQRAYRPSNATVVAVGDASHDALVESVAAAFDDWTDAFISHVAAKGRVTPGEYRAHGYRPPSHLWADIKSKWRGLRMLLGVPSAGSSPAVQQDRNLNRDAGIAYKKGEGAKLRR
jgi:predicted Zn-dependent peptidase